jgi:hypothetical protein
MEMTRSTIGPRCELIERRVHAACRWIRNPGLFGQGQDPGEIHIPQPGSNNTELWTMISQFRRQTPSIGISPHDNRCPLKVRIGLVLMQGKMNSCKAERVAIRKLPYHFFLHLVIGPSTSPPLQCVVDGSSPFCALTHVRAVIHGRVSHNLVRPMVPPGNPRSTQTLLGTSQLRLEASHKDRQLFKQTTN